MKKSIVCMGVDPGISNCGWGIVSRSSRCSRFVNLDSGVIATSKALSIPERLDIVHKTLCELFIQYGVDLVCVEGVYFNRNVCSCISTAHVVGVAGIAALTVGAATLIETRQKIKADVGFGRGASKKQVSVGVSLLLQNTRKFNIHHELDALAAAICGLLITK